MGPQNIWLTLLWILTLIHGNEGQKVRCDMPADVVFMLDASASIKASEWKQEKEFVGILIDSLAVEQYAIHVGLIVYSTEIGQVVDMQPFKDRAQLKAELPKLVQTSQATPDGREVCSGRVRPWDFHSKGSSMSCTDTARAIARMRQMMQNQARDNAKKIAIVITDGRSDNSTATIQEAVYARQVDGITMIALGVGNETFIDELQEVAKSDYYPDQNRLFTVRDFTQLRGVVEELRKLICEVIPEKSTTTTTTTTTTRPTPSMTTPDLDPISCPQPADVVFLLDGSHSISDADWARGRVFVTTLINSLEVDQEAIHAGIIVYSSGIGDTVTLKPFHDKNSLKAKASTLNQPPLGRTNTALGLRRLRWMFREQGRDGVPHIGIVITDGQSSNVQDTMDEAYLAKGDGIVMVVVGVGEDTLATELNAMATSRDTHFNVTDFSALFEIAEALREIICAIHTTTTTVITTTTPKPTPFIPALCQECLVKDGVGYNTYPPDCSRYVACYPDNMGGYKAVVKNCPFGLFWSSLAVACVDAAYVNCTADPCRGQPEGWGHTEMIHGCGEYWVCHGGHSIPKCCPQGQRFSSYTGCFREPSCKDPCTLQSTVAGSGACPYRPNPDDPFSYLQVMPGYGHVSKPCSPGTIYSQNKCGCVYYTPSLGCVPSIHYAFDATFDDRSSHRHSAHVHRVLLTQQGTAYFNGTGHVRINTLPSDEFRNTFVLKLRYRVQPPKSADVQWNDHYKWGLQEWFNTHVNKYNNFTFSDGKLPDLGPEPPLPSGLKASTLEKALIMHNGTVLHGIYVNPDHRWPGRNMSGMFVTTQHLGPMGEIKETAVSGGVVYVPNNKGHVLLFNPKRSPGDSVWWQIVSKDGRVMKSGSGKIPAETANAFQFPLEPEPTLRWFIMTATGTVLSSGMDQIPEAIKNLYAGYTSGKLAKVSQIGEKVVKWSVSRPDGKGATGGKGPIPDSIRQQLKLDQHLKPDGGIIRRWSVLSDSGQVLDSGTGEVPTGVISKYSGLRSGLILSDSDTHWQLKRPDGTPLLAGAGTLPSGVKKFVQGSMVLPSLEKESSWTARLPNGTRLSGKGPIPDYIKQMFEQAGGASVNRRVTSVQQSRWYVTDGSGKVLESGYGEVPRDVVNRHRGRVDTKVVQQLGKRGSNLSRWELRGQGGAVLASGDGQPPPDVFKVTRRQVLEGSTITSGANVPSSQTNTAGANQASGSRVTQGGQGTRRWTVTLPDGTQRSGVGEMPADIKALLNRKDVQTSRRWTVTLPDGSQRSGVGEIPVDLQALLASQGGAGGGRVISGGPDVKTIRRWTVTMPDGSTRSGTGDIPQDLQALLNAQSSGRSGGGGGGSRVQRQWSITLPNGTVTTGTGTIPPHLQALLDAQRSSGGLKTQRKWSVTLPDGSQRSGVGEIPADLQALMGQGQNVQRRWSVRLPDGSMRSGVGAIPSDLASLLQASGNTLSRGRRAARVRGVRSGSYQDVVGNCGTPQAPSFLLSTTLNHVTLVLRTTKRRSGAALTLPVSPGMNDVQFVFDGKTLSGFSNGIQKSMPLTGSVVPVQAPVTIGKCRRNTPAFRGEIDEISISACLL